MDDLLYGKRDKRGNWKPVKRIEYPPVFVWPMAPVRFLKWFFGYPGYILPWNLVYAAAGVALWCFLTPALETMRSFSAGWIAYLLARNAVIVLLFFGAFHLHLYVRKKQRNSFKFNGKGLTKDGVGFLFRNQLADNLIWTFASGVPVWTAYEAVTLWAFANGYIPYVDLARHPIYSIALMLLVPILRDIHFYLVHRLIHWPPLYHAVHKLHHQNVNPGPWSGLAMHPVEHVLYFSGVLIHWIVPSHPVHAIFQLTHAGLSPAQGHIGFEKLIYGGDKTVDTHCYAHYLHHKYFECNYADGAIPLDRWFGSFHDGSDAAHEAMNRRLLARAKPNAVQ